MNDSAICGFLKMPPPRKNRPAIANATCHQLVYVKNLSACVSERNTLLGSLAVLESQQRSACAPAEGRSRPAGKAEASAECVSACQKEML